MTMEERLEKVERELAQVKGARFRKVVLVDKNDRERGALGVTEDGQPALYLLDERGRERLTLVVVKHAALCAEHH